MRKTYTNRTITGLTLCHGGIEELWSHPELLKAQLITTICQKYPCEIIHHYIEIIEPATPIFCNNKK